LEFRIKKNRILIIPQTEMEEAYLEEVYKLKNAGDKVQATRVNAMGLHCWAYLEIK
jgi:uncharacterized protein YdeI (YjbR/CyaY-like superfamily)